jgi:two-component system chemotaxis response regulator CheY
MNGIELVKSLRTDEVVKNTPIVVVTSDTGAENTNELKANNIRDIIYKPFRPEIVRALLLDLLGLEESDEENTDFEGCDF